MINIIGILLIIVCIAAWAIIAYVCTLEMSEDRTRKRKKDGLND